MPMIWHDHPSRSFGTTQPAWGWPWPSADCCCGSPLDLIVITHALYTSASPASWPGTITATAVNGAWSGTVSDVQASDNVYATDTWNGGTGADGDILDLTGYTFQIPSTATITSVVVTVERHGSAISILTDKVVQLIVGGSPTGNNLASGTTYGTSDSAVNYGGDPSSVWGLSLSPADVNDGTTFGVRYQPQTSSGGSVTVSLDVVRIKITYTIPASGHVTALDAADLSELWLTSLGTTSTGQAWTCSSPLIDADGNIYVRTEGVSTGGNTTETSLFKLDSSGNILWTWNSGASATTAIAVSIANIGNICFDNSGNVIVGHRLTATGNYFLSVIDSSGSPVLQIAYPSGTIPGSISFGTAARGVGVDSSDNIYVATNNTTGDAANILKFDSSGNYLSRMTGISARAMIVDPTADVIYYVPSIIPTVGNSNSARIITRVFCSSLTEDWHKSFLDIDSSCSATADRSYVTCYRPDVEDSTGNVVASAGFYNSTTRIARVYAASSAGTAIYVTDPDTPARLADSSSGAYQHIAVNQQNGKYYYLYVNGTVVTVVDGPCLYEIDPLTGATIRSGFAVGSAMHGIAARTV